MESWSLALKRGLKKLLNGRKRLENRRERTEPKSGSESQDENKNHFTPFA